MPSEAGAADRRGDPSRPFEDHEEEGADDVDDRGNSAITGAAGGDTAAASLGGVAWSRRRPRQCAWPLWGDGDVPLALKRCCGALVAGSLDDPPYCSSHLLRSVGRVSGRAAERTGAR